MADTRQFKNIEIRSDESSDSEGIVEGYAVTWDYVDSYRTQFSKGCFAKTIREQGDRIKCKYNHETLIGKVLEARENDTGLWVRAKLNLGVQSAKDTFEFLRDGTLDGFSFAFRAVKDHYEKGVRVFDEVRLFEVGPVDDPASDEAKITDVRNEGDESRSTNYDQTLADETARRAFWIAFHALEDTIYDIWYSNANGAEVVSLIDAAMEAAHGEIVAAAQAFVDQFNRSGDTEKRSIPVSNKDDDLAMATRQWLTDSDQSADQVAANTALTLIEVKELRSGGTTIQRSKLNELPEDVQTAYRDARRSRIEALCLELRGTLEPHDVKRIDALLSRHNEPSKGTQDSTQPGVSELLTRMNHLTNSMREAEKNAKSTSADGGNAK